MGRQNRGLFQKKGQPWTIQCIELQGPYARINAEQFAESLRGTQGIRDDEVFIRHNDRTGGSTLYYGTYYRKTDPETGERDTPEQLRKDILLIKELVDNEQRRFFLHAMMVPLPTPDVGKKEWNLQNVDAKYTLQVAAFVPTDTFHEHKEAAAKYCEYLRGEGFEAYYYHGTAMSLVTVGAFGEDALVREVQEMDLPDGSESAQLVRTYYSPEVLELQKHELLKYNLVNGAKIRERVGGKLGPAVGSQLVEMPNEEDLLSWE